MSTDPQMQSVAAQNALSGEKSFRIVEFAITGNPDADVIAGICAVLNQADCSNFTCRAKQRILESLAHRFKDDADAVERQ